MAFIDMVPASKSERPSSASRYDEIFVVDDDPAVRDSLSTVFRLAGYRVRAFMDGISFVAAARAATPACVLLDVYMPGKSGLDILKELDAGTYPAPIFVMSGRGDIATAIEAMRRGAFDFIEKLANAETLVARIGDALDAWTRRQPNGDMRPVPTPSFPGYEQLTPRERQVLALITAGACNREAATSLGISRRTVEVHRAHVMLKLGARNLVDLLYKVLGKDFTR